MQGGYEYGRGPSTTRVCTCQPVPLQSFSHACPCSFHDKLVLTKICTSYLPCKHTVDTQLSEHIRQRTRVLGGAIQDTVRDVAQRRFSSSTIRTLDSWRFSSSSVRTLKTGRIVS